MLWSDHRRYVHTTTGNAPVFPRAENYNNLDNFLHDIRMATRDEKAFRRNHQLATPTAREEFYTLRQADILFDVI
jgi:hypothetical protein